MVQDHPWPPASGPRRSLGPIGILAVVVAAVIIAGLIAAVVEGAHRYYAISPGTAPLISDQPTCRPAGAGSFSLPNGRACVRLVLPSGKGSTLDGSIMMVDVLVGPATPGDYLLWKLGLLHQLRDGTQLVPAKAILGTTPPSQLACQDNQQMTDATLAARVVALRRLGYPVKEADLGAQIDQVGPGTPAASSGLECNDLVTAINGRSVKTAQDLVSAIHALAPGQTAALTVSRTSSAGQAQTVQLTARLSGTPAEDGQPANPTRAFLGVVSQTRSTFSYPFDLKVEVGQIGGPSAGLALTLAIIDSLSQGQLTGGHRIAATGTIDLQGNVGDVGGVAQKAVAVRRAGAQIFFVPVREAAAARSEAGGMKIYPVATLGQALSDLESLGGRIPPAPASQNGAV